MNACKNCIYFKEVKGIKDYKVKYGYCSLTKINDEMFCGEEPACRCYVDKKTGVE